MRSILLAATVLGAGVDADANSSETKKPDRERVDVEDVLGTPDGQYVVVLKTRGQPGRFLPIWIGENEAMAIRWRLDRYTPPRPLTLNLLESIMQSTNIKLTEINIDALKGGVFLGRLRLRQQSRAWELDARPSDAIGLALGRGAAIWVSRAVLDEAALDGKDLLRQGGQGEPPNKDEPQPGAASFEQSL